MRSKTAFSVMEVIVAVGLFLLMVGAVGHTSLSAYRTNQDMDRRVTTYLLAQEILNSLETIKQGDWTEIVRNADGAQRHVEYLVGYPGLADGEGLVGETRYWIVLDSVYRDENGVIVSEGGTEDVHTIALTLTFAWSGVLGSETTSSLTYYVNDWNTLKLVETSVADFSAGSHDMTVVTNNDGGEVELDQVVFADWCNPNLTLSAYDLPGQGIVQSISAIPGEAFMGTGQNASGLSFIDVFIDTESPPNITVNGTFDGDKTNDVFGEPGYGYIATDTNAKEIVIIDIAAPPFSESGYVDLPGNKDAEAVYVQGDIGYALSEDSLYLFDLTSRSGSRPVLGDAVSLVGRGKSMVVHDDLVYVVTDDLDNQLQIFEVDDEVSPPTVTLVNSADLAGGAGVDVFVDAEAGRAYVATERTDAAEVFILDVSDPYAGALLVGTYDTGEMDPKGVVKVDEPRVVIVGSGGEEYQVIEVDDETAPIYCGGMDIDTGINDVASVINEIGDAYSYIATGDQNEELKVIMGGPGGGGGGGGAGYAEAGVFMSQVLDTDSTGTIYFAIDLFGVVPVGTTLNVQLRSSNQIDMAGADWFGSDGTGATSFMIDGGQVIPPIANGTQYIQYKVDFTSDFVSTPVFEEVRIRYDQ